MSALVVLKDAWVNREKLGDGHRSREMSAFLPAALEIQESPPHPLTRWVSRALLLLVTIGIVWAWFGEVNIVASAEGKIIPSSRVKQIQPLEKAVIKKIFVHEGENVSKGQALVEMDSTLTLADKDRLSSELNTAQLQLSISKALTKVFKLTEKEQNEIDQSQIQLEQILTANEQEVELYQQLFWQQWQQYLAQLQTLKSELAKNQAEQAASQAIIQKLEQTLPIVTQRAKTLKNLYAEKYASEMDYLQLEQERIEKSQDLSAERHRFKQLIAAFGETEQRIKVMKAEAKSTQLQTMAETQRQISALKEELKKATDINQKRILYAPVSGQVKELAISTEGGVVTEAQQLMQIVPDEEYLEVQVMLENKDIGFVREGMPAEIKVQTFPFTKYGVIEGEVVSVSNDATVDEQRGLIYGMQVKMNKNTVRVNGMDVKLKPGMAVTAEVQTGHRRIIEFFMAPLLRARAESIRER